MAIILIVEDDEALAEMLRFTLDRAGHEAHVCLNGVDALYHATSIQPHLIVLDLMMPWASGDAVLGFIRSTSELKHTQVLVVSAHPDGEKLASQLDADGFLQKPVDMRVFTSRVSSLLEERV